MDCNAPFIVDVNAYVCIFRRRSLARGKTAASLPGLDSACSNSLQPNEKAPIASDCISQKKSNCDSSCSVGMVLESNHLAEKSAMRGSPLAIRESDDKPHARMVVRHATQEIEAVTREIDHLAHILDLDEPRIEGADVHRE
jgi:hypothetical protein